MGLSPDGQKIVISALKLGTQPQGVRGSHERYIYTIPTAGGEPKQVSSGWARLPSFSPDGKFIAYGGYRKRADWPEDPKGSLDDGDLWLAPSDGGAPIKLANVDGRLRGPVWSPDGRFIAALHEPGATNDSKEMWVYPLSLDRSSAREPIKISLPRSNWDLPAGWTPGGELGVFMATRERWAMYTVPASGGKAVQITPASVIPAYARWSPDGKRIYFRGVFPEETKKLEDTIKTLYVPAAGGDPVDVPVQSERLLIAIVPGGGCNISPDGSKIAHNAAGKNWIVRRNVESGQEELLCRNDPLEEALALSPDGKTLAFGVKGPADPSARIPTMPASGGEPKELCQHDLVT